MPAPSSSTAPRKGIPWTWQTAGEGGLILWPLFGAVNQLLGGLAFVVILFWMRRRQMPLWFVAIPAFFMLLLPAWALCYQLFVKALGQNESWLAGQDWMLAGFGIASLIIEIWMIIEAIRIWPRIGGLIEQRA